MACAERGEVLGLPVGDELELRVVVGVDERDVLRLDHAREHLAHPSLQGDARFPAERPDGRPVRLALLGARVIEVAALTVWDVRVRLLDAREHFFVERVL